VIFAGSSPGTLYALNRANGAILWQTTPQPGIIAGNVYSGMIRIRDTIIFTPLTDEVDIPLEDPSYPCCTTGGVVAAIDRDTGDIVWQNNLLPPAQPLSPPNNQATYAGTTYTFANGPSGSHVWGVTVAYSEDLDLLYFGTGQNYSPPLTNNSDSLIALRADTGEVAWITQTSDDDIWNEGMSWDPLNPRDKDVGDGPQIYMLGGRQVVAFGTKRGIFFVLDAASGMILNGGGAGFNALPPLPSQNPIGGFNVNTATALIDGTYINYGAVQDSTTHFAVNSAPCSTFSCPVIDHTRIVAINAQGNREICSFLINDTGLAGGSVETGPVLSTLVVGDELVFSLGASGTLYCMDTRTCHNIPTGVLLGACYIPGLMSSAKGRIYAASGVIIAPGAPTGLYSVGIKGL